jgi:tripartite-type tricarboxylate transporter receptor subunit TctC
MCQPWRRPACRDSRCLPGRRSWTGENARDVTERISREINAAFARADVREQLERQAFEYAGSTPDEMAAFLKDQLEVWTRVAREAGIKPE